jgi:seryl-tRNA synthetase
MVKHRKLLRNSPNKKKINAKLQGEISKFNNDILKIKSAFESLKEEHALLLNELNNSSKEIVTKNYGKECETCLTLQNEISSLKLQLEETSKSPKEFDIIPCKVRHHSKKSNKKKTFFKKENGKNRKSKSICHYCGTLGVRLFKL